MNGLADADATKSIMQRDLPLCSIARLVAIAVLVWLAGGALLIPTSAHSADAGDLARAAQNPIADMLSLPLQNNTNFNFGPLGETQNILNIQPVYPVHLNEEWNFITRTIVPLIS